MIFCKYLHHSLYFCKYLHHSVHFVGMHHSVHFVQKSLHPSVHFVQITILCILCKGLWIIMCISCTIYTQMCVTGKRVAGTIMLALLFCLAYRLVLQWGRQPYLWSRNHWWWKGWCILPLTFNSKDGESVVSGEGACSVSKLHVSRFVSVSKLPVSRLLSVWYN